MSKPNSADNNATSEIASSPATPSESHDIPVGEPSAPSTPATTNDAKRLITPPVDEKLVALKKKIFHGNHIHS